MSWLLGPHSGPTIGHIVLWACFANHRTTLVPQLWDLRDRLHCPWTSHFFFFLWGSKMSIKHTPVTLTAVNFLTSLIWKMPCSVQMLARIIRIPYSWKIWWGIKFGSLGVRVETAKLKPANIILDATHNDVMHAVALLALSGAPLRKLYM